MEICSKKIENIKQNLQGFFNLLIETKEILIKLEKYKGNSNYKEAFLKKVNNINRASKFLDAQISTSSNNALKNVFNKIKGDIETIIKYKDAKNSLEEISYLEEKWPEIEIASEDLKKNNSILLERNIHPEIIKVSEKLFNDGHYAPAIEEAFKKVVLLVKEKSGKLNLDGCGLMTTTFSKDNPILKFNNGETQIDKDEQMGWMLIYQGAVLSIRNVKAHGNIVQKDPVKTLEYLSFASLLCRRLDDAIKV
ncbi:TIGR02391 family protein [Candidatus Woesearchaeota archaeon CG10_big_fil_rev_8_21_14_0_10_32_24]|nr:MAG: TIGR02391 family protein [Candidatus Woesearchaeota archaeon CG10_big_fil_rev_8_21_14_0_10_32_24]